MEYMLCNKQYTGKSETAFNLKLNNYRKDVNKRNSLQADQHFDYLVTTYINTQKSH